MARPNGSSNGTNLGKSKARNPEANAAQREICVSLTAARYMKGNYRNRHMPRIGCGLAGGKWEMIEPLIQRILRSENIEVFVYDLEGK
jgi:hypothetical protein